MLVREYQEVDIAEISRLYYETVHRINSRDYTEEQIEAWAPRVYEEAFWRERFQRYRVYVATEQGVITGFAEFEGTGHIDCFYVHHDWQRKGVGSRLLERIEQEAKEQGISRIFAEVSLTARPFFENKGFLIVREQEKEYRNKVFKLFFMEKQLEHR